MKHNILRLGHLFTTYDIFVVNVVIDIMSKVYKLTDLNNTILKFTVLCGVIFGHLLFGILSDKIGRKTSYIITSCLIILGDTLSMCSLDIKYIGIFGWLTISRLILGIGVGGDSPIGAVLTSELKDNININVLIKNMCIICSMKGFGEVISAIVLVIVTHVTNNPEIQWRIALGFSIIPMSILLYYRTKFEEIPVEVKPNKSFSCLEYITAEEKYNNYSFMDIIKENSQQLVGMMVISFISGYIFYANGLFSGIITRFMGISSNIKGEALHILLLQMISFPGYILSIFYIEKIGCRRLLILGFLILSIIYLIISCFHPILKEIKWLYVILYGMSFFFRNFGPDTAIYILRTVIFPTEHRTTCNGIISASGKIGAICGIIIFYYLKNIFCKYDCEYDYDNKELNNGFRLIFGVCSLFSLIGLIWSYYFINDKIHSSLLYTALR